VKALLAAAACAPLCVLAAPASDKDSGTDLNVKVGYDRTLGKYGQQRETTLSTSSVTVSYDTDDFSFDVMAPYLEEKGPGRVFFLPGRRPVILVGPARTASGQGDVTAGVTRYLLDQDKHAIDLELGAILKLGTASVSKGLGTGQQDVSVQAALSKVLVGIDATLTAGYSFLGKAAGLGLKNSFYGSFDASYKIVPPLRVGATYSAGQTSATGTSGSRDATAYVEYKVVKRLKVELYYLKGWSTESPDRGGGVTVAWDLW
jgi:hypothetical protein